jgi:hypothetical protein
VSGTPTDTRTGTLSPTNTQSSISTQTQTPSPSQTQTTSPTNTHTQFPQQQAQQQTQDPPNNQYITIGSVLGCLVLMTIVAIAILINTRPKTKKPLHFMPTMMNVPTATLTANPIQSSRILFPPIPPRADD